MIVARHDVDEEDPGKTNQDRAPGQAEQQSQRPVQSAEAAGLDLAGDPVGQDREQNQDDQEQGGAGRDFRDQRYGDVLADEGEHEGKGDTG